MASNSPPAANTPNTATENTPLLLPATSPPSPDSARPPRRNVTFNPNPVTKTIEPEAAAYHQARLPHHQRPFLASSSPSAIASALTSGGPPMLSALNNKLRRRNSHGGVSSGPGGGLPMVASGAALPKIGPQRSTKNAQKLKLLPNPELEDDVDEESGRDVYSQYTRIKDPTARRDAARLGKADRDRLPRVTAYCTANKYQMDGLLRFLKGRGKGRGANAKLIDECIYTPYSYAPKQAAAAAAAAESSRQARLLEVHSNPERRHSTGNLLEMSAGEPGRPALGNGLLPGVVGHESADDLGMAEEALIDDMADEMADFDIHVHTPEVFLFDYGVVVIWGMTAAQEQRFLKEIAKFEVEKLAPDDVETERFNFYYTREYQARIYNDFITLRDKNNYMTKLAISHALAQSVKTSLFEELIASTIDTCKDIPARLALTGTIALSRAQINMQIGELFILRISIHLNGSVLDTPELFWVEPQLEPVYQAVRSYLEMDQRVGLITERLDVIADLLAVLKEQLSHGHGEKLEWIVIILIAAEIVVALVNIVVDLWVGVD
ncbi:Sad1-interacting factor 2 [Staphylotrichum tortipilum]|uniref:Sad1-interacting factor 2 n=1 Tax=Staphylotrichum tortipilum TaxID=2831512 RepID=A0AAN6MKA2_9PEZI|nr:Sad1-interacting factor 2 [Staphylotrichum longicolle]